MRRRGKKPLRGGVQKEKGVVDFHRMYNAQNLASASSAQVLSAATNPVYTRLIENLYRGKQPVTSNMSGPGSATEHVHMLSGRRVYIFGETHGREQACFQGKFMDARYYFRRLLTTTSAFIDFFLEAPSFSGMQDYSAAYLRQLEHSNTMLDDLRKILLKCTMPKTRNVEDCQLARIHYTDIRFISNTPTTPLEWLAVLDIVPLQTVLTKEGAHEALVDLATNSEKAIKKYVFGNPVVTKAIQQVKQPMQGNIVQFIQNAITQTLNARNKYYAPFGGTLSQLANALLRPGVAPQQRQQWATILSRRYLTPLTAYGVDLYTMARMFKTFKNPVNQPAEAYNSIVYAGEAHAQALRAFLTSQGFELTGKAGELAAAAFAPPNFAPPRNTDFSANNGLRRCLNMDGVSQPLFG